MRSFFLLQRGVQILYLFHENQTPRSDSANCVPLEPMFCPQIPEPRWRLASGTSVRGFSATAWYTGKALKQSLLANVPIGLVRSSWGGTTIQSWSSPDAIGQCPGVTETGSKLFNGMIAPFAGLRFKAVVW